LGLKKRAVAVPLSFSERKVNIMKTFTVYGKEYPTKDFDFNMVCDLENQNVSLKEAGKKSMD